MNLLLEWERRPVLSPIYMDSNQNNPAEEENMNLAKKAFDIFNVKMDELFRRQHELFTRIIDRINKRNAEEQRKKLDDLYKNK